MLKLRILLNNWIAALFLLAAAFALTYNPLTKFPWTFVVIIGFILMVVYLQNNNLSVLNFKKLKWKDLILIVLLYAGVEILMDFIQPIVNDLLDEPVDYSAFDSIRGNLPKYIKYLFYMWISAGIGEELLFRAFAFAQLRKIVGDKKWLLVLLSAVLFSLPHLYQGSSGLVMTFLFGIFFWGHIC